MNHIFCIHSSVVGHLGCFQLLAIINKAMNIVVPVALWAIFWVYYEDLFAVSLGRYISNVLRNLHIDFHSGCTSLQSQQQWRKVLLSPYPWQHGLSPEILILAILIGIRWNLRVVLICIFLITKGFEHFFRFFSAIWDSSVVNSD